MSHKRKKKKSSKNIARKILSAIFLAAALIALVLVFLLRGNAADERIRLENEAAAQEALEAEQKAAIEAEQAALAVAAQSTPEPTLEPTPEPEPEYFTLSFIGDNTLWATSNFENNPIGLPKTVGDDFAYPYSNTVEYFSSDEFTLANLECSFSDEALGHDYTITMFPFLARTDYVNILLDGGVDFVTMANNHTMDFYEAGLKSTQATLEAAGLPYGAENQGQIVTTPNGLKLGIWTAGNDMMPNKDKAVSGVADLRAQGADIVICMFHWGQELYYAPNDNQTSLARACIDAGADIVYGSHPHCLQPIEIYNGKIIIYSAGNWVFGGNTMPSDPDTAIIQVKIKRDIDGSISYDSFEAIPCSISSNIDGANAKANNSDYSAYENYNDYCPTPYEPGSEGYERAMSKLTGEFEAKSQGADYTNYYASWG